MQTHSMAVVSLKLEVFFACLTLEGELPDISCKVLSQMFIIQDMEMTYLLRKTQNVGLVCPSMGTA